MPLPPQMAHKLCSYSRNAPVPIHARGSLINEDGAVERKPVIWLETIINHLHHPQDVPGTH